MEISQTPSSLCGPQGLSKVGCLMMPEEFPLDFDAFNFLVPTPTLTRDVSLIRPQMDMLSSLFAFSPCPTLVGGQEAVFRLFNLGTFSRVWLASLSVLKSNSHLGPVATHKCSNEKADLFGLCP